MPLTTEHIEGFFEQLEKPFTHEKDDSLWYAEITAGEESFEFFVNLDAKEGWIYFTINPFAPTPATKCLGNLSRHLVRLNYDVTLVKFVLDDEGDIALTVELPTEDFTYAHFTTAIAALVQAASENYDEVSNLAHDPTAISSYL